MRRPHCLPVLWVLSLLGSITGTVLTPCPAAAQAPRAKIVSVEGAATTYEVEGMSGQLVTVEVPSQSTADIKAIFGKDFTVIEYACPDAPQGIGSPHSFGRSYCG